MHTRVTRRRFLKQVAVAGAVFPIGLPRLVLSQTPGRKLQHASIGVGGMGGGDIGSLLATGKVEIVAICDVDENTLNAAAQNLPNARKYRDWRELLAAEASKIDSVNVSTPDHMHAPITMTALRMGKHVYCQKPLTHEIYEARQVALAAHKAGVVTQMGIQIHSHISYRMAARILQDGAIGKVKEWHSWSNAPSWPQGMGRPEGEDPVPPNLNWDAWIGVAPFRPYKTDTYHPFKWRGWQDFGGGAMGDFGCHIFDPVFTGIKPGAPLKVQAESSGINNETWPQWEIIHYEFAGSSMTAGKRVKATWYDGGKRPPRELAPMPEEHKLPDGGSLIIGEEGVMVLPHWAGPMLYPLEKFQDYPRPKLGAADHYARWVDACLGEGDPTTAGFDYAGPLTEAVLLGNVATRLPGTALEWDAARLRVTNSPEADRLVRRSYREGWRVEGLG
jgi:predicted dehydrogenase